MKNLFAVATILAVASSAQAVDLAVWNWETATPADAPDVAAFGPYTADAGVFAASSGGGGSHASALTDWSTPVGNGSFNSLSSNNWANGDYYQFVTPTTGYVSISFAFQQTRSSTGPDVFDILWSTDGSNFSTLVDDYTVAQVTWSSGAPVAGSDFGPYSLPAGADNQANLYIRIVAQNGGSSLNGTNRVDNIVVAGVVPTPGTIGLMGIAGLVATRRRRA